MIITANNPNRKSWLKVAEDSDFPIQNIPFGVFITRDDIITIGSRIGNFAIDLGAFHQLGYFKGIPLTEDIFLQDNLNDFIADGRKTWRLVRNRIAEIFDVTNGSLRDNPNHKDKIIFRMDEVEMLLPVAVGDFTDFSTSRKHATNLVSLFNGPNETLSPNWLQMPVGYHGRSSSIVPSGTKIRRPYGQTKPNEGSVTPNFGPTELLDFELEMAFITTDANVLGDRIPIEETEENIFGLVQLNDWSAKDIQSWEKIPLGPFIGKNFASTISPWIVTLDALEPFRVENPNKTEKTLPYLKQHKKGSYDINLQVAIKPEKGEETVVAKSNFKYIYWTMAQQLAHHTVNGCPVESGDLMGSGTISGPTDDSCGSMLELTWNGKNPIKLKDGTERKFINDNDTVIMRAHCKNDKVRIGFGECVGKILPAK
ncbi:fumarylacetoacetase [Polaribacter sargassicola]|uniref:fumarylacetoacetase n=1 Tax=Polaribacter sargassicola TaxID=2836891 RepID=UPI001F00321A|nr:fumarylacetoacetase [Polaribacter sp. DS7-9]MCG1036886.1 fumarylacetoacetase [Polaribacter sp. DS7-9]